MKAIFFACIYICSIPYALCADLKVATDIYQPNQPIVVETDSLSCIADIEWSATTDIGNVAIWNPNTATWLSSNTKTQFQTGNTIKINSVDDKKVALHLTFYNTKTGKALQLDPILLWISAAYADYILPSGKITK
jgi:hypothetical protein